MHHSTWPARKNRNQRHVPCFSALHAPCRPSHQVFATHTRPNFELPWQRRQQYTSKSTGFAVKTPDGERWLLTNAHSVSYATQVGNATLAGEQWQHARRGITRLNRTLPHSFACHEGGR